MYQNVLKISEKRKDKKETQCYRTIETVYGQCENVCTRVVNSVENIAKFEYENISMIKSVRSELFRLSRMTKVSKCDIFNQIALKYRQNIAKLPNHA